MNQEKLNDFIKNLELIQRQSQGLYDLGLIVKEPGNKIKDDEIYQELKKLIPLEKNIYNNDQSDEDIIKWLVDIFQKEKWGLLVIRKDIKSPLLNQLKHLANSNNLQLINFNDQDVFEMKLPEKSRVIILIDREFIEKEITYPHFYRIFGPVLSLK